MVDDDDVDVDDDAFQAAEQSESDARLAEGTEHLQVAAKELIAAARSFLDVAEDAIEDSAVIEEVGSFLKNLAGRATDGGSQTEDPERPPSRSRVRRINVE